MDISLKKHWFIQTKNDEIQDFYDFSTSVMLGSGGYAKVYKVKQKNTQNQRAIKSISKSQISNSKRLTTEINVMKNLDHPNVIKLFEVFEDQRNIYLVMELCEGGELFERILQHPQENVSKMMFKQIVQAINYLHHHNICHRDIKPENFLFLNNKVDSPLKVIDLGWSTHYKEKRNGKYIKVNLTTQVGSLYYISPEVINGEYDQSCDIWSMGVILYLLLVGHPPFDGKDDEEIIQNVSMKKFKVSIKDLKNVSEVAKDLLFKMFAPQKNRITCSEILEHQWLKEESPQQLLINIDILKKFTENNKLKRIILFYMASQLQEREILEVGQLFKQLDLNGDGMLTLEELAKGLQQQNQNVEEYIKAIDFDANGSINYTEFVAACLDKSIYFQQEKLLQAFQDIDLDRSGKISAAELKKVLGNDKNKKEVWDELIKQVDNNGDGEIDYNEFIDLMF